MRCILVGNRMEYLLFGCVTKKPGDTFKVNTENQRIDSAQERGLAPKKVLADSLYGGDDNCRQAKRGNRCPGYGAKKEDPAYGGI